MTRRAFLQVAAGMMGTVGTEQPMYLLGSGPPCPPPGFVLGSGVLNAADHESDDGWFALGTAGAVAIQVVPHTPAWRRLMELRNRDLELVVRPYEK